MSANPTATVTEIATLLKAAVRDRGEAEAELLSAKSAYQAAARAHQTAVDAVEALHVSLETATP